jgi:hypothetical protein
LVSGAGDDTMDGSQFAPEENPAMATPSVEHPDVLIAGAGISGVGAALIKRL